VHESVMAANNELRRSSAQTYSRPTTRQRVVKEAPQLEVPDINDNKDERKRVLNVLAQRRYSQSNAIKVHTEME
jgi:hypothetical protein